MGEMEERLMWEQSPPGSYSTPSLLHAGGTLCFQREKHTEPIPRGRKHRRELRLQNENIKPQKDVKEMPPKWLQDSNAEPHSWQAGMSQPGEGSLGEWHWQNISLHKGRCGMCGWALPTRLMASHPLMLRFSPWTMCLEQEDRTQTCPGLGRLCPVCSLVLSCPVIRAAAGEELDEVQSVFWDQSIPLQELCGAGSSSQQPGDAPSSLPVPLEPMAAWLEEDSMQRRCCTDPEG